MKVLGFCEGARTDTGGFGIVGVPLFHRALAARGHHDVLAVGGEPMISARPFLQASIADLFDSTTTGNVGVVSFPALGRYCFSPSLYGAALASAPSADFIALHSMYSFPVLAGYAVAKRYRKPFGLWPHGVFAPVQRNVGRVKKAIYDTLIGRRILSDASVLFYSADGERDEARSLGLKTPSVVIPEGIDSHQFKNLPPRGRFRHKHMNGHEGPVVLYLGRLNVKKGLDLLVESMARVVRDVPNARLVIAGGGHPPSYAREVEKWVIQAGIQQTTLFTGLLDETDKLSALSDCDLFVLPSAAENFGFAMFEAMASARPVVCSDTLNFAGEVTRYGAGLVVKRTAAAFATAMTELLCDADRRQAMGQNGQRLAENYSWETCGRRVEAAIQCVLTGQPFPTELKAE